MEDDQQFCLRWNNHQSTLIQNFDTLLESGTLVDCTLAAEGKYLKAHKVVLSACSPYFEGLLSEHYDKHPVFILKDVKFKELKAMMDYMYRGEVNISQDQLSALLKAAESLQIKGLSDSRTGAGGGATTGKADTRPLKTASSTTASSSVDIPHGSSGLTIEKNSKVPRQSLQQVSVSDLPEDSASPQLRGFSSREGSQSPTRKKKRSRKRSLGNDDNNSMENHEASNSSDVNISAPALGVAPVAEEKSHADPADSIGRSALMQQLTKPADEMLQIPIEKPEPSEEMIQPKSEYLDDQESVEDLTNLDDDMNDLNEMEQDNSRAGPSHDPSQHPGLASWHIAGDRSNASVVGAAAGPPGSQDEVFLAAHEAAQAQRDSQEVSYYIPSSTYIKEDIDLPADDLYYGHNSNTYGINDYMVLRCSKCLYIIEYWNDEEDKSCKNCSDLLMYHCIKCDNSFETLDISIQHLNNQCCNSDEYECTNVSCNNTIKSQIITSEGDLNLKDVNEQDVYNNETNNFKCSFCSFETVIFQEFTNHNEKKHVNKNSERRFTLYCNDCKFETESKIALRRHIKCKHALKNCLKCGKDYTNFYVHLKTCEHRSADFKCPICLFGTTRKVNLKSHINTMHIFSEEVFQCNDCDFMTDKQTKLTRHLKLRHTFVDCKNCGRTFRYQNSYQHKLICGTVPRFKCTFCNYVAKRAYYLKLHIDNLHSNSNNRSFRCLICTFTTKKKRYLQSHVRRKHTNSV